MHELDLIRHLRRRLPEKWGGVTWGCAMAVIRWYLAHDLLRVVAGADGEVAGCVFARRVPAGVDAEAEPYAHAEDGDALQVDWLTADSPAVLDTLLAELPRRWATPPSRVTGVRARRAGRRVAIPLSRLRLMAAGNFDNLKTV